MHCLVTPFPANAQFLDLFKKDKAPALPLTALTYSKASDSSEVLTPFEKVSTYNNFYEFGTDKGDPVEHAHNMTVNPWTLKVEGLVENPLTLDCDDLLNRFPLQERIYRLQLRRGLVYGHPMGGL